MKVSELKKIAEGREAEIFEWEEGTVLRLMREAEEVEPNASFACLRQVRLSL